MSEPHWMMIMSRNEYIFMIEQQWLHCPPDTIEIQSDLMVEYERMTTISLSTTHQPCEKESSMATFVQCFHQQLKANYEARNISCISHFFASFLYPNNNTMRTCDPNEADEAMKDFYHKYRYLLINYAKQENSQNLLCRIPCSQDYFYSTETKLTIMSEYMKPSNVNILLFLGKSLDYSTVYTEILAYDLTAITASIGGGIGIFLGYSCFGMASRLLHDLFKH